MIGSPDFLDGVEMRDLGEDFLFFRIECKEGEIFCVETAENIYVRRSSRM